MEKVKTIKEMGSEIEGMLSSPDVNFNQVRAACTKLEARITGVQTKVEWGGLPKTKKALEDELKSVRLRLERAAAIFHSAQVVIRYRRSERAAFARRNNRTDGDAL